MKVFSPEEREKLLALKGVGPTVLRRLEALGHGGMPALARQNAQDVCAEAAAMLGASCWKNSPQARNAVQAAIDLARDLTGSRPEDA